MAEAFERFAGIDLLATIARDGATDRDALAARPDGAGPARGRGRHLGRPVQPRPRGADRAAISASGAPRSSTNTRSPRRRSPGPTAARPARGRAVRALCLRRRARQRLRRADRRGRAAPPLRGRDGREDAGLWRDAIRSTRISWQRLPQMPRGQRHRARLRPAGRCWPPAPPASIRCSGRRFRRRAVERDPPHPHARRARRGRPRRAGRSHRARAPSPSATPSPSPLPWPR